MKPSPSAHIGFGLLALLLLYAAPYAWFRSGAITFSLSTKGPSTVFLRSSLPGGKSLTVPQEKTLGAVYQPLMWLDSKLTGSVVGFETMFPY